MPDKNSFQLTGNNGYNGYDWWWHSFVGEHETTHEQRPFFIEYFVINPKLWKGNIVLGQQIGNQRMHRRPVYAMIKAGCWGREKVQLNNFYGIDEFKASPKSLVCKIGKSILTENLIKGWVTVDEDDSLFLQEMMSDIGSMSWSLKAEKKLTYDVGYGSSKLFNKLNAFTMYWHVGGMITEYEGEVIINGERYVVKPETSYGYQDKNWGSDFTNPWIWLNCNNFVSVKSNQRIEASLDVGGGCPVVFGYALKRKILTAFYYEGKFYEFNFSKFWKYSRQKFSSSEDSEYVYWEITSQNRQIRLEIDFRCRKDYLLKINYENPLGEKNHTKLWNGGHAEGTVKIYKNDRNNTLIDELKGSLGGCEYGAY